jgi:hypothetical protein
MTVSIKRPVAAILALVYISTIGCAGTTKLNRDDLAEPPQADTYHVSTRDGRKLDFIALHLEDDWLVGTVRHTDTEANGEGAESRTSVTNRYEEVRIPYADVTEVTADKGDGGPSGLLLAGGAIVAGAVAFLLLSGGSQTQTTSGGGGGKGL